MLDAMRVLAFDISTSAGWALLEGEMGAVPKIIETGLVKNDLPVSTFGEYPWSFAKASRSVAKRLANIAKFAHTNKDVDVVVVEESNRASRMTSRYSQKIIEFLHCQFLNEMLGGGLEVVYVNTSDWRKIIGGNLTKADKAMNIKVRKLKKAGDKEALKALGVRGKVTKKHVAIRYVNATFGLDLKMKDNDIADAICQGTAFFLGVKHCDGK